MSEKVESNRDHPLPLLSLRAITFYFLKLGAIGFGGPIALCGAMHRDLVELRRWFKPEEYSEGFALAQLAPGPVATQLAMYFGWLRFGVLGATCVGVAFVLPSFLMVIAIAEFYRRYQDLSWIQAAFVGVGAAVIAVIIKSISKLVKTVLLRDSVFFIVGMINLLAVFWLRQPSALLFIASGLVMLLIKSPPKSSQLSSLFLTPFASLATVGFSILDSNGERIFFYFLKAGAFVFGTGLAIIPFLHGAVVEEFKWLSEKQFLDAVSVALITPGPAVITVAFIGYLVEGVLGAIAAALGVFLPVYIFVIVLSPLYRRFMNQPQMRSFVDGVTAGAIGALVASVIILGSRSIVDQKSFLIFAATGFCLWKLKKIPDPILILTAGIIGWVISI